MASFVFAGGAARGHVPLHDIDNMVLAELDAYVADVRLGSYEPADAENQRNMLTCRVDATYHFYCLATGAVGRFCLTWVRHEALGPSAMAEVRPTVTCVARISTSLITWS